MKYDLKLLISPAKFMLGLIIVILMPVVMYVPTYFDFINVSSMYLPFVGMVLFADISLLDKGSGADEIVYMVNRKPVKTFLARYFFSVIFLLFYAVFMNVVFAILQQFQEQTMVESLSLIDFLVIVMGSSLFVSTIAMTISAFFGNVYVGYSCAGIFWIYWNVNCEKEMILNPFSFIANPIMYGKALAIIYVFTGALLLIDCLLCGKSPFYFFDKKENVICLGKCAKMLKNND